MSVPPPPDTKIFHITRTTCEVPASVAGVTQYCVLTLSRDELYANSTGGFMRLDDFKKGLHNEQFYHELSFQLFMEMCRVCVEKARELGSGEMSKRAQREANVRQRAEERVRKQNEKKEKIDEAKKKKSDEKQKKAEAKARAVRAMKRKEPAPVQDDGNASDYSTDSAGEDDGDDNFAAPNAPAPEAAAPVVDGGGDAMADGDNDADSDDDGADSDNDAGNDAETEDENEYSDDEDEDDNDRMVDDDDEADAKPAGYGEKLSAESAAFMAFNVFVEFIPRVNRRQPDSVTDPRERFTLKSKLCAIRFWAVSKHRDINMNSAFIDILKGNKERITKDREAAMKKLSSRATASLDHHLTITLARLPRDSRWMLVNENNWLPIADCTTGTTNCSDNSGVTADQQKLLDGKLAISPTAVYSLNFALKNMSPDAVRYATNFNWEGYIHTTRNPVTGAETLERSGDNTQTLYFPDPTMVYRLEPHMVTPAFCATIWPDTQVESVHPLAAMYGERFLDKHFDTGNVHDKPTYRDNFDMVDPLQDPSRKVQPSVVKRHRSLNGVTSDEQVDELRASSEQEKKELEQLLEQMSEQFNISAPRLAALKQHGERHLVTRSSQFEAMNRLMPVPGLDIETMRPMDMRALNAYNDMFSDTTVAWDDFDKYNVNNALSRIRNQTKPVARVVRLHAQQLLGSENAQLPMLECRAMTIVVAQHAMKTYEANATSPNNLISDVTKIMHGWAQETNALASATNYVRLKTDLTMSSFANLKLQDYQELVQIYGVASMTSVLDLKAEAVRDRFRQEHNLHLNCADFGKGGTSKSFHLDVVTEREIAGTITNLTYQSARAMATDGNSDDTAVFFHEAQMALFNEAPQGNNTGGASDSGQESTFKELLTSMMTRSRINVPNDDGTRTLREVVRSCIGIYNICTNSSLRNVSEALKSRFFWFSHEAGANEQSNIMDQKLAREIHRGKVSAQIDQANAHHQLISYLHMLVEKLIFVGAVENVLLTGAMAMAMNITARMKMRGVAITHIRFYDQFLFLTRRYCITDALYSLFFRPGSPYQGQPITVERVREIEPMLFVQSTHVVYVLGLMESQIMPTYDGAVAKMLLQMATKTSQVADSTQSDLKMSDKATGRLKRVKKHTSNDSISIYSYVTRGTLVAFNVPGIETSPQQPSSFSHATPATSMMNTSIRFPGHVASENSMSGDEFNSAPSSMVFNVTLAPNLRRDDDQPTSFNNAAKHPTNASFSKFASMANQAPIAAAAAPSAHLDPHYAQINFPGFRRALYEQICSSFEDDAKKPTAAMVQEAIERFSQRQYNSRNYVFDAAGKNGRATVDDGKRVQRPILIWNDKCLFVLIEWFEMMASQSLTHSVLIESIRDFFNHKAQRKAVYVYGQTVPDQPSLVRTLALGPGWSEHDRQKYEEYWTPAYIRKHSREERLMSGDAMDDEEEEDEALRDEGDDDATDHEKALTDPSRYLLLPNVNYRNKISSLLDATTVYMTSYKEPSTLADKGVPDGAAMDETLRLASDIAERHEQSRLLNLLELDSSNYRYFEVTRPFDEWCAVMRNDLLFITTDPVSWNAVIDKTTLEQLTNESVLHNVDEPRGHYKAGRAYFMGVEVLCDDSEVAVAANESASSAIARMPLIDENGLILQDASVTAAQLQKKIASFDVTKLLGNADNNDDVDMFNGHYLVPLSYAHSQRLDVPLRWTQLCYDDGLPLEARERQHVLAAPETSIVYTHHWNVMQLTRAEYKLMRFTSHVIDEFHDYHQFFSPRYTHMHTCTYPNDAFVTHGKRTNWEKAILATLRGAQFQVDKATVANAFDASLSSVYKISASAATGLAPKRTLLENRTIKNTNHMFTKNAVATAATRNKSATTTSASSLRRNQQSESAQIAEQKRLAEANEQEQRRSDERVAAEQQRLAERFAIDASDNEDDVVEMSEEDLVGDVSV